VPDNWTWTGAFVATKHINIGKDAMANGSEANVVSSTRRASVCRQR
jgi:hypothetical protein